PGLEVDGSGDIEESSTVAMSDTTLDCKFQKAGVPGHIGTQGSPYGPILFELQNLTRQKQKLLGAQSETIG
ncbi:MAG: hypothetical protein ACYCS1_07680, partial [Gammaproteobacteria bacterium]